MGAILVPTPDPDGATSAPACWWYAAGTVDWTESSGSVQELISGWGVASHDPWGDSGFNYCNKRVRTKVTIIDMVPPPFSGATFQVSDSAEGAATGRSGTAEAGQLVPYGHQARIYARITYRIEVFNDTTGVRKACLQGSVEVLLGMVQDDSWVQEACPAAAAALEGFPEP